MNIVKEILSLKKQVKQLYCYLTGTGGTFTESDPTVPQYVKDITTNEIAYWNERREDANLYITEKTDYANVGDVQLTFNRNIAYALENLDVDTSDKADLNAGNVDVANAILWRNALDVYNKSEVDNKFYQGGEEALTELTDVSLTANVLYISYIGENGNTQTKSVDLSGLVTIDIHIEDASYNAATNIISLNDNDGNEYNIDLSEFSIITETRIDGVTTLTQEAVTKLTVSKVGQTGEYADLLNKPTIPAPVDISNKLDKPTTDGTWVVTKSGSTITYTNASTLGKNIANSNLTSVAGAGMTLGAPYVWSAANQPFSITGLPDKSSDTNFNSLITLDNTGRLGKGNGKTILKAIPSLLTEAEKTAWKTEMNGGWTTNTMSVGMVSPLIINRSNNNNTWITLLGANLNVNPANFTLKIMSFNGQTEIASIPNSQVQLYPNGTQLIFYYNFSTLPLGKYRFKLNNGIADYITNNSLAVDIVSNVQNINTSSLTWVVKSVSPNNNTVSYGNGSNAYLKDESSVNINTPTPIISVKSASLPLIESTDNFYLSLQVSVGVPDAKAGQVHGGVPCRVGLCYSDYDLLNNTGFNSLSWFAFVSFSDRITTGINTSSSSLTEEVSGVKTASFNLIFIKNGNILIIFDGFKNRVGSTTIDTTKTLSIIAQIPDYSLGATADISINIDTLYKF